MKFHCAYTGGSLSDHTIFNKNKGGKVCVHQTWISNSIFSVFVFLFFFLQRFAGTILDVYWLANRYAKQRNVHFNIKRGKKSTTKNSAVFSIKIRGIALCTGGWIEYMYKLCRVVWQHFLRIFFSIETKDKSIIYLFLFWKRERERWSQPAKINNVYTIVYM